MMEYLIEVFLLILIGMLIGQWLTNRSIAARKKRNDKAARDAFFKGMLEECINEFKIERAIRGEKWDSVLTSKELQKLDDVTALMRDLMMEPDTDRLIRNAIGTNPFDKV
jgi:hypothetical protein